MSVAGIYTITNKQTQRVYIGSSDNLATRWNEHRKMLSGGTHHNKDLQADYDEMGEKVFQFWVYGQVKPPLDLKTEEQRVLVTCLKSGRRLYNQRESRRVAVTTEEEVREILDAWG